MCAMCGSQLMELLASYALHADVISGCTALAVRMSIIAADVD
jgi:hypothetical protein